jgi:hypothetical protein
MWIRSYLLKASVASVKAAKKAEAPSPQIDLVV